MLTLHSFLRLPLDGAATSGCELRQAHELVVEVPPRLRRMRILRLRRFVGFFAIWTMMVVPIIILYERNRGPSPLWGFREHPLAAA